MAVSWWPAGTETYFLTGSQCVWLFGLIYSSSFCLRLRISHNIVSERVNTALLSLFIMLDSGLWTSFSTSKHFLAGSCQQYLIWGSSAMHAWKLGAFHLFHIIGCILRNAVLLNLHISWWIFTMQTVDNTPTLQVVTKKQKGQEIRNRGCIHHIVDFILVFPYILVC